MLFPKVKKYEGSGVFSFKEEIKLQIKRIDNLIPDIPVTAFGKVWEDGNFELQAERDTSLCEISPEAYALSVTKTDKGILCKMRAAGDEAFIRGLFCLKRMMLKNEIALGDILDYPSFATRGYIEGFYGKPWKSEERLEMLELMALFGENTHYYAPKDDPYHRNKWRECYPEKEASALKVLVDKANSLYMKFTYCIAPGLSMRYSSDEDFSYLCEKTKQLFSMGISSFGLLLDDIPRDLFYEEDKVQFGNAVNAHVVLVNKYYDFIKALSPDCILTVCPTAYHGKGNEEDVTGFASNVPEDVLVFFTGSDICSKELTTEEAAFFTASNRHKPLYWDNYPVNDAEMFMEMHLGPVIGRSADLHNETAGLISNCMEYFNCNKFPLITIASYLWNSEEYDPEESFNEAVRLLLPENEREAFILLSDHCRTACLKDENSRIMGEYLSLASVKFLVGDEKGAIDTVKEYAFRVREAVTAFKSIQKPLYTELSRWLKKFYLMSDILDLSINVLEGTGERAELASLMEEYNESATVLTGFCFREYIESVLGND